MQKEYIKVIVGSGKDQSLRRFHPWVFSGAIKKIKKVIIRLAPSLFVFFLL